MTSIGFNRSSINDLMSIVDDNKESINEMQYIRICNAVKFLHDKTYEPIEIKIWSSHPLSLTVNRWERKVRKIERYIEYAKPMNNSVKNIHRQKIIEEIYPNILIDWRGVRNGVIKMKQWDITKFVDKMIHEHVIDIHRFKERCYQFMIEECDNNVRLLSIDLEVAKNKLEDARNELRFAIENNF